MGKHAFRAACLAALVVMSACKSEDERAAEAWEKEYGALLATYRALPRDGAPEIAPEVVKGRRVLTEHRYSQKDLAAEMRATSASEVGIVILDDVEHDAEPSATYEDGSRGWGGTITVAAFAHPEKKLLASSTYRCLAPYSKTVVKELGSGRQVSSFGDKCYPGDSDIQRYAEPLFAGRAPEGSNASDTTTKGFEELAEKHAATKKSGSVSLSGRKVLFVPVGETLKVWQKDPYVTPAVAAGAPDAVGVIAYLRTTRDAKPSVKYSLGTNGFGGKSELVLVAVPEDVVAATMRVSCTPLTEDEYLRRTEVLAMIGKEPADHHCNAEPSEVGKLLADAVR